MAQSPKWTAIALTMLLVGLTGSIEEEVDDTESQILDRAGEVATAAILAIMDSNQDYNNEELREIIAILENSTSEAFGPSSVEAEISAELLVALDSNAPYSEVNDILEQLQSWLFVCHELYPKPFDLSIQPIDQLSFNPQQEQITIAHYVGSIPSKGTTSMAGGLGSVPFLIVNLYSSLTINLDMSSC